MTKKTKKRLKKLPKASPDKKTVKVKVSKEQLKDLKAGKKATKAKTAPKVAKEAKPSKAKATRKARTAFTELFALPTDFHSLAKIIQDGLAKVKGVLQQPDHKDYVAWAIPGTTGTPKRIGGLWVHGGVLCVQIRWMAQDVLDKARKSGFTIYGTPKNDLKCNRFHVSTEKEARAALDVLTAQAKAIQANATGSQNLNS